MLWPRGAPFGSAWARSPPARPPQYSNPCWVTPRLFSPPLCVVAPTLAPFINVLVNGWCQGISVAGSEREQPQWRWCENAFEIQGDMCLRRKVEHWLAFAEEARRHAEQMTDADAKRE